MSDLIAQLKRMPEYDELRWAAIFELERLQAVADAARKAQSSWFFKRTALDDAMLALGNALRALDGEVKP